MPWVESVKSQEEGASVQEIQDEVDSMKNDILLHLHLQVLCIVLVLFCLDKRAQKPFLVVQLD
jgi:hypothetical protein